MNLGVIGKTVLGECYIDSIIILIKNQGTDKNNNPPRDDIDKFDAQEENWEIELPNIEKRKWNDYQPQISKIYLPQIRKKTLNFEITICKIKQNDNIHGE